MTPQILAGVLLFAAELVATAFPAYFQTTIEFVGGTYQVVVPWAVCLATVAYAAATRQLSPRQQTADPFARAIGVGIVVDLVLLLAGYASYLGNPSLFSARAYWWYARGFSAGALAALTLWTATLWWQSRPEQRAIDVPVALATALYAAALLRFDWVGAIVGLLAGGLLAARGGTVSWRDERVFLLATFVVAVGLRLFYTLRVMTNPDYIETGGDGLFYEQIATSLAHGLGTGTRAEGYPMYLLGYPRFIAAIYMLAGQHYFVVCAVQALFGGITCLLIYSIARQLFGVQTARIAALFTAFSFQLIFTAATYSHEAVDLFLTPLSVWLLMRAIERDRGWWIWLLVGVVLGAGITVRELHGAFFLFVLVWLPFALRGPDRTRCVLRSSALVIAGAALMVLPLLLPKVATAEGRHVLTQHLDRLWINPVTAGPVAERPLVSPFTSPSEALDQLQHSPSLVIHTALHGVLINFAAQFFGQPSYGGFDLIALTKYSPFFFGVWFWAYVLTAVGLGIAVWRWRSGDPHAIALALVVGLIVSRTAPHLILESHYRHRAPIEAFLIMLAAVAAVRLLGGPRALPSPRLSSAA